MAKYTWPEFVEIFDEFPRTPSLKVVKRDVVRQILEALARAGLNAVAAVTGRELPCRPRRPLVRCN